jgi:hypothetical protein
VRQRLPLANRSMRSDLSDHERRVVVVPTEAEGTLGRVLVGTVPQYRQ